MLLRLLLGDGVAILLLRDVELKVSLIHGRLEFSPLSAALAFVAGTSSPVLPPARSDGFVTSAANCALPGIRLTPPRLS